ncbi:MAG TPA: response regulator [Syntrophorhabdaceae bacterium]|jgi:DNA-binding NtrC family response regulator
MNNREDGFRILIVDDNVELREILGEYLQGEGDFLEGAGNGKEALAMYGKRPYDLIITDLNMPLMSGMDLLKGIAKYGSTTECIIITGYASLDTAIEAVKLGAFDYIVKPFRMEELRVVVKNARDKIMLKKVNARLFEKLSYFYEELEKYKKKESEKQEEIEPMVDTEGIINDILKLEKIRRGRFLIE